MANKDIEMSRDRIYARTTLLIASLKTYFSDDKVAMAYLDVLWNKAHNKYQGYDTTDSTDKILAEEMNRKQKGSLAYLLDFASEVQYNDGRYAPKDINHAVEILQGLLD